MANFVRRAGIPLTKFDELMRCQTPVDYRSNKLLHTTRYGVRLNIRHQPVPQTTRPCNNASASRRLDILRRNARKELKTMRRMMLDDDIIYFWPEARIGSFGVVDKCGNSSQPTGRTIHDLPYPAGESVNAMTNRDEIQRTSYQYRDAVARVILD
ncbi:hypothetical protein PybrP1_012868 [[Pythium] brassicae (nom. inval.)]|nr:hypothetical protein PybrP1_012868 [[Pythium] brassicae (nom. inval.)]